MTTPTYDVSSLWEQYPKAAGKLEQFAGKWIGALQQIQVAALENVDSYIPEMTHEIKKNAAIVLVSANARLLMDFFDAEGLFIWTLPINLEKKEWEYTIDYVKDEERRGEGGGYNSRIAAETGAYGHAFKILEELS